MWHPLLYLNYTFVPLGSGNFCLCGSAKVKLTYVCMHVRSELFITEQRSEYAKQQQHEMLLLNLFLQQLRLLHFH